MVHGDDKGLRLPPRIAPTQVVIVPIWRKDEDRDKIEPYVGEIQHALLEADIRVQVDWRDQVTPGFKFNDWEMRGVPLRVEIGPRDVDSGQAVLVRRDSREKNAVSKDAVQISALECLESIQQSLLEQARRYREEHTTEAQTWDQLTELLEGKGGFVWVDWCDSEACTQKLAAEKATVRAIPFGESEATPRNHCICCGEQAEFRCVVARSY
jgi:prolyl-tRNA synthetase